MASQSNQRSDNQSESADTIDQSRELKHKPGIERNQDGSDITYAEIDGKVVPTRIEYTNGVVTEYGWENGKLNKITNVVNGKVWETWNAVEGEEGQWTNPATSDTRFNCEGKIADDGTMEGSWTDKNGKRHTIDVNTDGSTVEQIDVSDGVMKPNRLFHTSGVVTDLEYDGDGNLKSIQDQTVQEGGKTSEPFARYISEDGGKTFRLEYAPPGSGYWHGLSQVEITNKGTFKCKGSTGQSLSWALNENAPTIT